jgi:dTDP-4-dehydrorhamnose reductase
MSKTVLVAGAAGQLGVELVRTFETAGWAVRGLDRRRLDITSGEQVSAEVQGCSPQLVINAAAYNQVDLAESDPRAAFEANALAVRNLAIAARDAGAQLVHFSTDYVFDGTKRSPYVESDATHPIGAYAVSKLAGELFAQAYLRDALIIRTSGVFGPGGMYTPRGNFPELMLRLAKQGNPIRVVDDHVASPTYAPAMATRTLDLVQKSATGIFHMGGGEPISWYRYARLIFELAGVDANLEATDETTYRTAAKRPKFSALLNQRMEQAGVPPMPSLRDAVSDYMRVRTTFTAHRSS